MSAETNNDYNELPLVTFNSIYSLLREEKKTKVLLNLPEKYYPALNKFFEDKKDEIKKYQASGENSKLEKEKKIVKSSKNLAKELVTLRLIKISAIGIKTSIFEDEDFNQDNILEEELVFLDTIIKQTNKTKKIIN